MAVSQILFFDSLGWAVINSLWQIGLLWLIYKIFITTFAISSTTAKVNLSATLLFTGFLWFIITLITNYRIAGSIPDASSFISVDETTIAAVQKLLPYTSVIYLILLLIPLLRFMKNYRYVQVIRKQGISRPDAVWRIFVQKVAAQMNITKRVQVFVSAFVHSPITIGFLRPVILLPIAAINNLTTQQTEALLLHELTHIRRYDYLLNFAIQSIHTILYFNPFVKAFVQVIEKEREKSCDEMVLQFQYSRYEYASALLQLQQSRQPVFFLAATGEKENLLDRINLILEVPQKATNKIGRRTVLAILFCGLFVLGGSLLNVQKQVNTAAADFVTPVYPSPVIYTSSNTTSGNLAKQADEMIKTVITDKKSTPVVARKKEVVIPSAVPVYDNKLQFVNYQQVAVPALKKYQENQVKSAVDASKRIIEELQWKQVEKNLAEVFTAEEKKELYGLYSREVNKFDWSKWENRLRTAYDKVDWETVNNQLSKAVNQVRMDSLRHVYNEVISRLNKTESVLKENNAYSVPDTDITLNTIEERKEKINSMLDSLRSIRSRKIIKL